METRKARLINYLHGRIISEIENGTLKLHEWTEELDAMSDIVGVEFHKAKDADWDWTITKNCELRFQ